MSMVTVLATMPAMWQRVLVEHIPDNHGRCWECRDSTGVAASWPCIVHTMAQQAEALAHGGRHSYGIDRPGSALRAG